MEKIESLDAGIKGRGDNVGERDLCEFYVQVPRSSEII